MCFLCCIITAILFIYLMSSVSVWIHVKINQIEWGSASKLNWLVVCMDVFLAVGRKLQHQLFLGCLVADEQIKPGESVTGARGFNLFPPETKTWKSSCISQPLNLSACILSTLIAINQPHSHGCFISPCKTSTDTTTHCISVTLAPLYHCSSRGGESLQFISSTVVHQVRADVATAPKSPEKNATAAMTVPVLRSLSWWDKSPSMIKMWTINVQWCYQWDHVFSVTMSSYSTFNINVSYIKHLSALNTVKKQLLHCERHK